MKFLQVHTFYHAYLDGFYAQKPMLKTASFQEQIDALVKDGFSGIHMFAPYMAQHGYECGLIIANNAYSQSQWLASNNVSLAFNKANELDIVRKQIEMVQPDVLYLSDPIAFDSKFIHSLPYRPKLILGWRASDIPGGTDWSQFDVILSGVSGIREMAVRLGASHAEKFFPGFPLWMGSEVEDIEPAFDVSFTGSWTTRQHSRRNDYLTKVAKASRSGPDAFSCAFHLSTKEELPIEVAAVNQGPRFGMDMCRALRAGRIAIDARVNTMLATDPDTGLRVDMAKNETMNMRIFEATGCGVFLLTEYFDNLKDYFEIGKEIEVFRDEKELIDKIRYYLDHRQQREEIAKRGQQRCLRDYSMAARSVEFDKIIKKHIGDKQTQDAATLTRQFADKAVREIDNGNLDAAFAHLSQAKALKSPMQGLDLLRAVCLVKLDRMTEVRECLKEELRYFPDNASARKMLSDLDIANPKQVSPGINDPEFNQLYNMVSDHTMLSPDRLYSLYKITKKLCINDMPGDVVECGVAGGGSTALMAYTIKKYSKRSRTLYAFDSFDGMPEPTEEDVLSNGTFADDTGWGTGTCAAPVQSVKSLCAKLGVDEIVKPVKGYFQDTLPQNKSAIGQIAFMHVDGDWYESTKCIFENLYDQVVDGGFVQIDDYGHWAGCRKAVQEFEQSINVNFSLNKIDGTGVWFAKPESISSVPDVNGQILSNVNLSSCLPEQRGGLRLLNLGCGSHYHPSWINVDTRSTGSGVIAHDLNKSLVCEGGSFDVVYHSHVLEHLSRDQGSRLVSECHRVLKPGGIIRVAVPDLEQIARWYLKLLEESLDGVKESQDRYEWIKLELLDQMARNYSGGEMRKHWSKHPLPAESFVVERVGSEVLNVLDSIRRKERAGLQEQCNDTQLTATEVGEFRLSGENHQWMYDSYSLARLLQEAGFAEVRVCRADESIIPDFNGYLLDIEENSSVRKPDSLFMEAIKRGC